MSHKKPTDSRVSRERIADGLLSYLKGRPNAMDTLDGIADSWLSTGTREDRTRLAQALEDLVASGDLERVVCGGVEKFRVPR